MRPRVRAVTAAAVAAVAVGVLVSGCSTPPPPKASKAFCRAADEYNTEIEHEQKTGKLDVDRQIKKVEALARTAPKKVKHDAQVFLDALRTVKTDPSIKDDPDVKRAVDNVNRLANQACGVYKNNGI